MPINIQLPQKLVSLKPASLWKELQLVRTADDDDAVFPSKKTGGALKANQVRIIVGLAGKRAGIKSVSPHYFRHSHASHSLDRGASLHVSVLEKSKNLLLHCFLPQNQLSPDPLPGTALKRELIRSAFISHSQ